MDSFLIDINDMLPRAVITFLAGHGLQICGINFLFHPTETVQQRAL